MDIESFSADVIANKTLHVLSFYISATEYLKEEISCFIDVNDLELTAKLAVIDNPGQVISDYEEKVLKKKNKCVVKGKKRLKKLCAPGGSLLFPRLEYSSLLSPRFMPTPMPTPVFTSIFRPGSPTILSSYRMSAPTVFAVLSLLCSASSSYPRSSALSSYCLIPILSISRHGILALLLPLLVLDLPLSLESSLFKIFKQLWSDELWPRVSTSPAKPLHPFQALGLYNPTNNNERKQNFDPMFTNSRLLAGNHDQEKVDLSFAGCSCHNAVKLNTMKLVFKLGLKINRI